MSRAELQTAIAEYLQRVLSKHVTTVQIIDPVNIETVLVDVELLDKPTTTKARVQTSCSACGGSGHNVATRHKRYGVRQSTDVALQEDVHGESDQ